MVKYRSAIAFILMLIAVTLVSFSGVAEAKTLSYTTTQVEEIQTYTAEVVELRDRLPELATLVEKQNWTFVRNFIHGPLGELRTKMAYISRSLLPGDQVKARDRAKDTFKNLVAIDAAAEKGDYKAAVRSLDKAIKGLDSFLELVPQG
ncbi:photosystem II protein PsbQ [Stenomitos frigidus]|uniref:Photosystem II protein PsbQ n=1 Tax=Stenomitos frigidus ULC18 TaxID=2107698 RepID=A0A2T1EA86_9CYAN|nr:photosystem II protein PsbQ [Stenomitos frigidus]PSB29640.1 photosystem II protein PsbQ [Stenomitos frigidus ULC18]